MASSSDGTNDAKHVGTVVSKYALREALVTHSSAVVETGDGDHTVLFIGLGICLSRFLSQGRRAGQRTPRVGSVSLLSAASKLRQITGTVGAHGTTSRKASEEGDLCQSFLLAWQCFRSRLHRNFFLRVALRYTHFRPESGRASAGFEVGDTSSAIERVSFGEETI